MKTFVWFLVLLAIAAGVYYLGISMQEEGVTEINFEKAGTLVVDSPGLPEGVWHINYEEAGSPALTAALLFDGASQCMNSEDEEIECVEDFEAGQRVSVRGEETADGVLVDTLTYVEDTNSMRAVNLYYYNPDEDTDDEGNIMCSREGLVAVERTIEPQFDPTLTIAHTIQLLLRGELTEEEEDRGIETEYPLEGFELSTTTLNDGELTLTFNDPANASSGGSCRAGILWMQISETALQFDEVDEVNFMPEELFQP